MDVRFPDGTVIRALGLSERKMEDRDRDYGLYFDPAWRPTWPSDVVEWKDVGLPRDYESAAEQIRQAFLRAKRGERVEIDCIGGLGRTGTALAGRDVAQLRKVVESLRHAGCSPHSKAKRRRTSRWSGPPARMRSPRRLSAALGPMLSEGLGAHQDL